MSALRGGEEPAGAGTARGAGAAGLRPGAAAPCGVPAAGSRSGDRRASCAGFPAGRWLERGAGEWVPAWESRTEFPRSRAVSAHRAAARQRCRGGNAGANNAGECPRPPPPERRAAPGRRPEITRPVGERPRRLFTQQHFRASLVRSGERSRLRVSCRAAMEG